MRQLSLKLVDDACAEPITGAHCHYCGSKQPMLMLGHYPLLYCGKDAVLYQCVACGSERTAVSHKPATGH